jgi:hypothetical protein
MRSISRLTLVLAATALLAAGSAFAAGWQKLGSEVLLFKTDQGQVEVKKGDACTQIKIKVASKGIKLTDVKIVFEDGSSQTVDFDDQLLRPGDETDPIEITGGAKKLQSVQFTYSPFDGLMNGRARVTVEGWSS